LDARIRKISKRLFQIILIPPIPGFDHFISVWVSAGQPSFIVDTGPDVTAGQLCKGLAALNIRCLDYIFLTHLHMDHAGGIGTIAARFPEASIVCHPFAIPHLMDPSRLQQATIDALGDTGRAYGVMRPVPRSRLVGTDDFHSDAVRAIDTPGHSADHVSYENATHLFAGEAGGVFLSISRKHPYLRPATPPRFYFNVAVMSLDRLISHAPRIICYGHCGWRADAVAMLKAHKKQLFLWEKIIGAEMALQHESDFYSECADRLLQEDSLLAAFSHMDPATAKRERFFLLNSIRGFSGYLQNR